MALPERALSAEEEALVGPGGRLFAVSELTVFLKELLEGEPVLSRLWVKGEVSNFKHHASGHMYFTLKDEKSRLKCVFFRGRSTGLRFRPEDGMKVIARGQVSIYEVSGEYQLYVEELHPAGQGDLAVAFEQLKKQLAAEGLFEPERKRPIPFLPRVIGVVTSPSGAAFRDIVSVLRRRHPNVHVLLAPAIVQGDEGPPSVVAAIQRLNNRPEVDVLIVGRGGGSLEELWTFNDERVARAIAASRIPVISAVGHETDFTIADFVADKRAPTPSAAAEMAVPERAALVAEIERARQRLGMAMRKRIEGSRQQLGFLLRSAALSRPHDRLNQWRQQLDELQHRAALAVRNACRAERQALFRLAGKLDSLSPLATLARGYALCRLPESGALVTDAAAIRVDQAIEVVLHRGELVCRVQRRRLDRAEQGRLPIRLPDEPDGLGEG